MKCECSLTNEYEIVGLCDIQKFNKKISSFEDKSWAQISISDNLILSGDKPSIKSITKTFVTVQITSTKLINTPKSNVPNIEGTKLTGKLLLVAGEIVQRVLYVGNDTDSKKVNSFKIKTPFTTYIVIKQDADISLDKYCVYSCIEYASLRIINDKSLSQNVTLFLFAHLREECKAVDPPGPDPEPVVYPNEIIFTTKTRDKELAVLKFDNSKNIFEVSSTEHFEPGSKEAIVKFEIFESDGATRKENALIVGEIAAIDFVTSLNGKGFEYGNIINITYFHHPDRVKITNHPSQGEDYDPKFTRSEAYIITEQGLIPYVLLSKIVLKNSSNQSIIEFNFSKIDKRLRVVSTGNTAPSAFSTKDYFKIALNKLNGGTKFTGIIKGNEDGRIFKGSLDMKLYSIGDTIDVFSEEPNKVEITNHPNEGTIYTPTDKLERFKITNDGVEKIDIPKEYPNEVILRNDSDEELAKIKLNIDTGMLEVTSTGANQSNKFTRVSLYKANSVDIFTGVIQGNEDANQFVTALNGKSYASGDVIDIVSPKDKLEITNYPNKGDTYKSKETDERFRITANGLIQIVMRPPINTEIKFINSNSSDHLVSVKFDNITSVLRAENHSGGALNDHIPSKFELYGLDGTTLKASGEIRPNTSNMSPFVNALNGVSYKTGYIIKISYGSEPEKLRIDNFNPNRRDYEKGFDNNQVFIIQDVGLAEHLLPYKLKIRNNSTGDMANLYFSTFDNKIKVIATSEVAPSQGAQDIFPDYFKLILYRDNQAPLTATIPYSENSNSFKQAINEQPYSIGGTLSIIKDDQFSTRIEDFTVGSGDRIRNKVSRYEITENWLDEISSVYPNEIVFKNDNGYEMARVVFKPISAKLLVTKTTDAIIGTGRPVLQFRLYAPDGTTLKANGVISENAEAVSFVADLNGKDFEFEDIIKIGYGNFPTRVQITNYPNYGDEYVPKLTVSESFIIKEMGLTPYII